jgi:hypothetical protein
MTVYGDDQVGPDLDVDTVIQVRHQTSKALRAGRLPQFGSPAWCALASDDPRKLYATIRAALVWWGDQVWSSEPRTYGGALAKASRDIAAGADWPALIRDHLEHQQVLKRRRAGYGGAA